MADQNTNPSSNDNAGIRRPRPDGVAQDPQSAATQQQVHADADAIRAEAARIRATTPSEIRDRTVGQIVEDAERRADR